MLAFHHQLVTNLKQMSPRERVVEVIETKPIDEIPARLAAMEPFVETELPAKVAKALADYAKALADYDKALDDCDNAKARADCDKALADCDKALADYAKALADCDNARADRDNARAALTTLFDPIYRASHPSSAWNGSELVFPKS
jgi:tetratricopeptide (TPR) repeat protein